MKSNALLGPMLSVYLCDMWEINYWEFGSNEIPLVHIYDKQLFFAFARRINTWIIYTAAVLDSP